MSRASLSRDQGSLNRAKVALAAAAAVVAGLTSASSPVNAPVSVPGAGNANGASAQQTPLEQAQAKLTVAKDAFATVKAKVDGHAATLARDSQTLATAITTAASALAAEQQAKRALDTAQRTTAALTSAYWNAVAARRNADSVVNNYRGLLAGDRDRLAAGQKVLATAQAAVDSAQVLVNKLIEIYGKSPTPPAGGGNIQTNNGDSGSSQAPSVTMGDPTTYAFPGTSLSSDWTKYRSPSSDPNNTRNPANASVSDGVLHLKTTGASGSGVCHCGKDTYPRQPFGRWEVRAKMDANADHGGAIMLWPNSENWPVDGEIDLAEFNGARTEVAFTIHYDADNKQRSVRVPGDYTKWHTFRVDWSPTGVVYFIDDKLVAATTDRNVIPQTPMHLSVEAGPNSRVNASNTTSTLDLAWVKVSKLTKS